MNFQINYIADCATAVAAIIAAISLGISAYQTNLSRRLAETAFEDTIDQQYRELAKEIPVDVLIDNCDEFSSDIREIIFNYLDLCNQQIYLRAQGRIGKERWKSWCDGIQENLRKTAFHSVWSEVKEKASFSYLERLDKECYKHDPINWK